MLPTSLTAIITWLAEKFGSKFIVYSLDKIRSKLQSIFASRNILILGSEQTGKTSLMLLLTTGKPYNIVNGEIQPPEKTLGYAVVDKKFTLNEDQWVKLKRDVPGEEDLRAYWEQAIEEVRPTGIIYMLDGRLEKEKLEKAIKEIFDEVLYYYEDNAGVSLEAFHIFVNFADQWGINLLTTREKLRRIEQMFDKQLAEHKNLQYIRFRCAETQLSLNKDSWIDAERALFNFGTDLI